MKHTVDLGIDLGTTNSVVAIVDGGHAVVLKDDFTNQELLPSCVAFRPDGSIQIGETARSALLTDPERTFEGFKRQMGTDWSWSIPGTSTSCSPEYLASLILQELRRRAAQALNEEPTEAVITVPAVFGEVEKHAVTKAARMAGFTNVTLVQEPVAAGLAYGWDRIDDERPFVVYDIGGGTFDASLMRCVAGQLVVLGHLGEHTLGGRDMDDAIAEHIVRPGLREQLAQNPQNEKALRICCEDAKRRLSSLIETQITLDGRVRSADGQPLQDVIPITRAEFEALILPKVDQTIEIVKRLLVESTTDSSELAGIILVGGPTRIPALRQRLEEAFDAPILTRIDPMTVVAQGAALFAASITATASSSTSSAGGIAIRLAYDPVTSQPYVPVGIAAADTPIPDGSSVRIRRLDGLWDSGLVRLVGGKCILQVMMAEAPVTAFSVEILGPTGETLQVSPDRFQITKGLAAAPPPLSRAIGVLVENVDLFVKDQRFSIDVVAHRGEPTPFTHRVKFVTTRGLYPGSEEAVLNVGFFEGPAHEQRSTRPERFRRIGLARLKGTDLDRPLSLGAEVEITVRVEASKEAIGRVYLPSLGKTLEVDLFDSERDQPPTAADLEFRVQQASERLAQLEGASVDVSHLRADRQSAQREVEALGNNSADSHARAVGALEKLEIETDQAEEKEAPRLALEELAEWVSFAEKIVDDYGDEEHRRRLTQLKLDVDRVVTRRDAAEARSLKARLFDLAASIYWSQPGAWLSKFQELASSDAYSDPVAARDLIARGRQALDAGDMQLLRGVVQNLASLLPSSQNAGPWSMFAGITRAR